MASGRKCLATAMAGDGKGDGSIRSQTRQVGQVTRTQTAPRFVVSLLWRWLMDLITLHLTQKFAGGKFALGHSRIKLCLTPPRQR